MPQKFECNACAFTCQKQSLYNKHIETKKHQMLTGCSEKNTTQIFQCNCGKIFKHKQSLSRHKPSCKLNLYTCERNESNASSENISSDVVLKLIHQNEELKKMLVDERKQMMQHQKELIEYCKQPKTINKNYNLNFFLNVKCKDALNLSDFVQNLKIEFTDLEKIGQLGYVDGVTRIIMNGLKDLDMYKRPIHCTDIKREILYVKDEDKWDKDDENEKVQKLIGCINDKNFRIYCSDANDSLDGDNPNIDKNLKIIKECNGGICDTNREKVIRNISKSVYVNKFEE